MPDHDEPKAPRMAPGVVSHFDEKSWDGHPLFQCKDCPWDTMDRELLADHQREAHQR